MVNNYHNTALGVDGWDTPWLEQFLEGNPINVYMKAFNTLFTRGTGSKCRQVVFTNRERGKGGVICKGKVPPSKTI